MNGNAGQIEHLLGYAILAPSAHNTQPWSFRVTPDGIEVYADWSRRLPAIDPDDRELTMSLGAAITNLRVAASRFGYDTSVLYHADGDPIALVTLRETATPDANLLRLFPAIDRRRTNRRDFDRRPLDPEIIGTLLDFIDDHAETLQIVLPHERIQIAELVEEGDRVQMNDSALRRELRIPSAPSWLHRRFDLDAIRAEHDRELAECAPAMIVVHADDDRVSLVQAGEVLERLLLLLTTLGLQYAFLNQPIEVASLREQLRGIARTRHLPQLLLRVGYARAVERATPRRDVPGVLIA